MRMVMIGGGLGNQISQYVFKRYIELNTGETCFFDDMPYFGIEEYEIDENKVKIVYK